MPAYSRPPYAEILQNMLGTVVVRKQLTDVAASSNIRYLCSAVARAIDEFYYQVDNQRLSWDMTTAQGADADLRAQELTAGNITRIAPTQAVGTVVFYTNTPGGTVSIPVGTQVQDSSGATYTTTSVGQIAPQNPAQLASAPFSHVTGQDSNLVSVQADTPGTVGNAAAGTLSSLTQKPLGVDGVYNPAALVFGADQESDDSLASRVRGYPSTLARSTASALVNAVLGAKDPETQATIRFANVQEDAIRPGLSYLFVDDGTGQAEADAAQSGENVCAALLGPPPGAAVGGETRLVLEHFPVKQSATFSLTSNKRGALTQGSDFQLNPTTGLITFTAPGLVAGEAVTASYTYYTGLIALAQKIVDGDPSDAANYPGYRAAGTQVVVQSPQILLQNVTAAVAINTAAGFSPDDVKQNVAAAIDGFINSLGIGDDLYVADLVQVAMSVTGVQNFTLSQPTADLVVLDSQLARIDGSGIALS